MVSLEQAVLLGIIQGITEWLPVSSSAHLALAQIFLGIQADVAFDIALHIGTLLAVLAYFRNDIFSLAKGLLARSTQSLNYAQLILLSLIPTAIVGFAFRDFFESMFTTVWLLAAALFLTGVMLLATKLAKSGARTPTARDSLLIGLVQGVSVAPGISRSGSTIAAALFLGIDRVEAARFSFLISILPILGAGLLEIGDAAQLQADSLPLVVGAAASAIAGYLSIGLLISLIRSRGISIFGYYCIALASLLLLAGA